MSISGFNVLADLEINYMSAGKVKRLISDNVVNMVLIIRNRVMFKFIFFIYI